MIDKIIYVALIVILIYISLELENDLRKNYYKGGLGKNPPGTGYYFFIALIFPWSYFRREKLLEGWFIYFCSIISFFSALYFLIKLLGII